MSLIATFIVPLMVLLNGGWMLARPQSFVGTGPLEARDPRNVRKFGWFFLIFGLVLLGLASLTFAEG